MLLVEFPCADERLPKLADFLAEMTLQSLEFAEVPVATVVRTLCAVVHS